MNILSTPNGDSDRVVDIFIPGDPDEIVLEPGIPLPFPIKAKYPRGGAFYIRIDAGSGVVLRKRGGSVGYPLDGLAHWPLAFDIAESHELVSAAGTTIHVLHHAEK